MILSQATSGNLNTNSASWTPIPGLALKVSQVVGETVLFILNVPNPWATGNNYPGGNFGIQINGQIQAPFAAFTYSEQSPSISGRVPTTLCVTVEPTAPITAAAVWSAIRGSTVHLDSPATLTMVL